MGIDLHIPTGIELHIEELVLHGFEARDCHRIAEAVQLELTRLIVANGGANSLKTPISLERIKAGAFKVQASAKPQQAGKQIAEAVFRSLHRPAMHQPAQNQPVTPANAASRTQQGRGGRPA